VGGAALQAVSEDLTRFRRQGGGTQVVERLEQAVDRHIRTQTDQLVEGIEIADVWRDPDRGTFYALAVLDRARAARRLRAQMAELDGRSEAALRQDDDPLRRVRGLYTALQAQWTRAALAAVGDALTDLGVTGVDGAAPYRLRARLDVQPVGQKAGWYWLRGTLRLALVDAAGRPLAAQRQPLKAAALDAAQAEARLLTEAARRVQDLVPRLVLGPGMAPALEGAGR